MGGFPDVFGAMILICVVAFIAGTQILLLVFKMFGVLTISWGCVFAVIPISIIVIIFLLGLNSVFGFWE